MLTTAAVLHFLHGWRILVKCQLESLGAWVVSILHNSSTCLHLALFQADGCANACRCDVMLGETAGLDWAELN